MAVAAEPFACEFVNVGADPSGLFVGGGSHPVLELFDDVGPRVFCLGCADDGERVAPGAGSADVDVVEFFAVNDNCWIQGVQIFPSRRSSMLVPETGSISMILIPASTMISSPTMQSSCQ